MSPWYAFHLVGERDTTVSIQLNYLNSATHRYWPKTSTDRQNWTRLDSTALAIGPQSKVATLQIDVPGGRDGIYVAAQEIHDSETVLDWVAETSRHPLVDSTVVGQSRLGKMIPRLRLINGEAKRRPIIAVLSRQHPPEVTGYLALQAFVDGLLAHPRLNELLTEYEIIIYPLMNPDGVDAGHWRHNAGGVDLNRDWAFYHQPEIRTVATDIFQHAKKQRARVVLGLDFHSTWKDVYYTHDASVRPPSELGDFKDRWLSAIERGIGGGFRINEEAEPIGRPTSMSWFRTQFNAEGITYEIGDGTPRPFIQEKGGVSANALIDELLR